MVTVVAKLPAIRRTRLVRSVREVPSVTVVQDCRNKFKICVLTSRRPATHSPAIRNLPINRPATLTTMETNDAFSSITHFTHVMDCTGDGVLPDALPTLLCL